MDIATMVSERMVLIMRLIDADALCANVEGLEERALSCVKGLDPTKDAPYRCQRWTAILSERSAFKYDILAAPTIDAVPVIHGEWIEDGDNQPLSCDKMYCCSNCKQNRRPKSRFTNYCSNCGAKMDLEG